jgi:hypothetical protein
MMYSMHRTQIQIDDRTYAAVRRRAYEEGRSLSAIVRDLLAEALDVRQPLTKRRVAEFASVGIGRSRQGRLAPVSERHDEALAEAMATRGRR